MKDRVNMKPPGIAITGDPVLRLAVNKVCSVRTTKVGSVTQIVRSANKAAVIAKDLFNRRTISCPRFLWESQAVSGIR